MNHDHGPIEVTDNDDTRIALVGVEDPFAIELAEVATRLGFVIAAGILTDKPLWDLKIIPTILQSDEISTLLAKRPAVISSNAPRMRHRAVNAARKMGFTKFLSLADPSANIAASAAMGMGAFVNAGATVGGLAEVKDFALINRNAALGHHSIMDEFSVIGPGAIVASSCYICRGATLGAGAVLKPDIIVGEGAIVGAGAVVIQDVSPGMVVAGNPARVINESNLWAEEQKNSLAE